jgi:hypothetical protein
MKVYAAIQAVASQMAKDGISKSRENKEQHFKFRGIDETLNALAPVLSQHGLVILPRIVSRTLTERLTQRGNPLFSVVVEAEFDFVAAEDGSKHTVKTYGEAMDTADKATNKAMSIAYKYAAFLAFCIPVEGMGEDADATKHEVAAATPVVPTGFTDWADDMSSLAQTADIDTFRDSYKASKKSYRDFLEAHDRAALDAMVARAKQNQPMPIPA